MNSMEGGGGAQAWGPPDPESAELVAGAAGGMGFDVLRGLAQAAPGQNVVLSPVSLAAVLAMLYNGAAGETAEAIAQVMHVPGVDRDRLNQAISRTLRFFLTGVDVELSVANSLWARDGAEFEADYLERLRSTFDAEVRRVDLGDAAAAAAIDQWVREHTRDRIHGIAEALDLPNPDALLVLLNAVYFKGNWTDPFDPNQTRPGPFRLADGSTVEVPMMSRDAEFLVYRGDGFDLVRLPYGDSGRFAMDVLVPAADRDLADLYATLDAGAWADAAARLEPSRIMLRLPRFELEYDTQRELDRVLQELGMGIVYTPESDFTPMSPLDPWLDTIVQKTFIRVDEEGTEAAAVTGGVGIVSLPPEISVDRPFLFIISDTETGIILFMGQVTDPR